MKKHFSIGLKLTIITMVLFGVVYPLFITGLARLIAPGGGNGETLEIDGRVVGFKVIGQSFVSDRYFNSRPSAVYYNAASAGGSNKSNNNPEYIEEVKHRLYDFLARNPGIDKSEVPVDLITASGGGLDPHISIRAARVQVKRIAKARGLSEQQITQLIDAHTASPLMGLFGPTHLNVLELNLALDQTTH